MQKNDETQRRDHCYFEMIEPKWEIIVQEVLKGLLLPLILMRRLLKLAQETIVNSSLYEWEMYSAINETKTKFEVIDRFFNK
jgi:hypothetical protein